MEGVNPLQETYLDMFLTKNYIPSNARLGKLIVMTRNENESPVCYYHNNECLHKGSKYCLQDKYYFCSQRHMCMFLDSLR